MVNPYRRGLGLGGRGETLPYTGGGSARPLEPYRGGGRAVQLEDDPYADPSRTGPTYGDDGAGESTRNRGSYDGYSGPEGARSSGPGNKGRRAARERAEKDRGWERDDYGYENRDVLGPLDDDIHKLRPPSGPDDEEPYWDRSKSETDALFERWRKKLKAQGYSDEEIDDILSDAVGLHD